MTNDTQSDTQSRAAEMRNLVHKDPFLFGKLVWAHQMIGLAWLSVAMTWLLVGCSPPETPPYSSGTYFRVTAPNGHQAWVLGSFHSASPPALKIADSLRARIAQSSGLLVEVAEEDVDPREILRSKNVGPPLSERLTPAAWQWFSTQLQQAGLSREQAARVRPWVAYVIALSASDEAGTVVMDTRIQQIAHAYDVPVMSLESQAAQLAVLSSIPEKTLLLMMEYAAAHPTQVAVDQVLSRDRYFKGDIARLWRDVWALGDGFYGHHRAEIDDFVRRLIDQRNARMAARVGTEVTAQNGLLVVVGALHLPGRQGVLQHLVDAGFQVVAVGLP
ncbi:TraB/GumN family protein [Gammaproteobacteria bacterium]|nr:TraB/GumN family protein [Gammaproteobacteria bacterium]